MRKQPQLLVRQKDVFPIKKAVAALKWSDVSDKKHAQIQKETAAIAKKIAKAVKNPEKIAVSPLFPEHPVQNDETA